MVGAVCHIEIGLPALAQKHAGNCGDVRQMRAATERIIDQNQITRLEVKGLQGELDGERHGTQMHRHVIAHGDGAPVFVIYSAGIIPPLLNVGAEGSAAQDCPHFLCDGNKKVAEDLQVHLLHGGGGHYRFSSPFRSSCRGGFFFGAGFFPFAAPPRSSTST